MPDRYEPLLPSELSPEQQKLYDRFDALTQGTFGGAFAVKNKDGAYIGPFAPLMYTPSIVDSFTGLPAGSAKIAHFPAKAREVAIIATGSVYKAGYELYAHRKVGIAVGLTEHQVNAVSEGIKPVGENELSNEEAVAFDIAIELATSKGPLSKASWDRARDTFGKDGTAALIHYVGIYAYTCILLNAVDASVPED